MESFPTNVGPARWSETAEPNSPTMNSGPLPLSIAFVDVFVAVVPLKTEGLLIEFYGAAAGYRDLSKSASAQKIRSIIRDKVVPSLARVHFRNAVKWIL